MPREKSKLDAPAGSPIVLRPGDVMRFGTEGASVTRAEPNAGVRGGVERSPADVTPPQPQLWLAVLLELASAVLASVKLLALSVGAAPARVGTRVASSESCIAWLRAG